MSSITKTLEELNSFSCQGRKNLLLRNMQINVKYHIQSAQRHAKTRSGKCVIKLNLDKFYIYLPKRFNSLSDDFLAEINNNKNYNIHSCGQLQNTYNLMFTNTHQDNEMITYDIQDLLKNFEYCPTHYSPTVSIETLQQNS